MELVQIEGLEVEVAHTDLSLIKKIGLAGFSLGLLFLVINLTGVEGDAPLLFLVLSVGLIVAGALIYILVQGKESHPGIKNDNIMFNSLNCYYRILCCFILVPFYIRKLDPDDGSIGP